MVRHGGQRPRPRHDPRASLRPLGGGEGLPAAAAAAGEAGRVAVSVRGRSDAEGGRRSPAPARLGVPILASPPERNVVRSTSKSAANRRFTGIAFSSTWALRQFASLAIPYHDSCSLGRSLRCLNLTSTRTRRPPDDPLSRRCDSHEAGSLDLYGHGHMAGTARLATPKISLYKSCP